MISFFHGILTASSQVSDTLWITDIFSDRKGNFSAFIANSKYKNINFCYLSEDIESITIGKFRHTGKLLIKIFLKH